MSAVTVPRLPREETLKQAGRDLSNGRVPFPTLKAVNAYADFLRFGVLPYGGGTFEQPAQLLEEMRIVHEAYTAAENAKANREQRRAAAKGRR